MRSSAGEILSLAWDEQRRAASHALALPDLAPSVYWVAFTATAETA